DLSSADQLKHVANHEQRIVRHNFLHPEQLRASDTMPVPYGVFTHPQVAWVGMDELTARTTGRQIRVAHQDYASIAYGWAMEDTTGFAKIIVDAETTEILGAHLIGPEATTLIQLLIQAMSTGQTARDLATTQYWIHPAMPEPIENALLELIDCEQAGGGALPRVGPAADEPMCRSSGPTAPVAPSERLDDVRAVDCGGAGLAELTGRQLHGDDPAVGDRAAGQVHAAGKALAAEDARPLA